MELWRQNRSGSGNYFLESFNYEQGDGMMKTFFHTMQNLGFLGISVSTQMDQSSGGSRGGSVGSLVPLYPPPVFKYPMKMK